MKDVNKLITDNIDVWASALSSRTSTGRGSNKKVEFSGIKSLRNLILELAIQGKLIKVDNGEVNPQNLLDQIIDKKKKLKKQKSLPPLSEDEVRFQAPQGWIWTRLGEVTNYGVADKAEPSNVDDDCWVLELEDVEKNTSRLIKRVRFAERNFKSSKNRFLSGDVIYGKLRPYLDKVLVADEVGVCTTEMIPIRAYANLDSRFLRLIMKSPYFIEYANNSTHGMNLPRMGTDKARLAPILIAPIDEQRLIVDKVDELMALCDQLEQQTEASIDAHQLLVEELLSTLFIEAEGSNSENTQAFEQNWARIAEHFDLLFTTEHSIEQLKQTILQLAVMGKLVPQDPTDEPASKLLERIAQEKEQLIKDKVIKKQKALPVISEGEKAFDLPQGWKWARLGNIGITSTGKTPSTKMPEYFGGDIPFIGPGQISPSGELLKEDKTLTEEGLIQSATANKNDLLMVCIGGSIGKSTLANKTIGFNQQINAISPIHIVPHYLHTAVRTDSFYSSVISKASGSATPIINRSKWEELLVPVAPLAEQNRILIKANELIDLCEGIKLGLRNAGEIRVKLANSIVESAIS